MVYTFFFCSHTHGASLERWPDGARKQTISIESVPISAYWFEQLFGFRAYNVGGEPSHLTAADILGATSMFNLESMPGEWSPMLSR